MWFCGSCPEESRRRLGLSGGMTFRREGESGEWRGEEEEGQEEKNGRWMRGKHFWVLFMKKVDVAIPLSSTLPITNQPSTLRTTMRLPVPVRYYYLLPVLPLESHWNATEHDGQPVKAVHIQFRAKKSHGSPLGPCT